METMRMRHNKPLSLVQLLQALVSSCHHWLTLFHCPEKEKREVGSYRFLPFRCARPLGPQDSGPLLLPFQSDILTSRRYCDGSGGDSDGYDGEEENGSGEKCT